ncbi:unnamed protein product [Clavelina lepadiformis]|uniref:NADH dehydrogenase [ubiquinone] 1 alpha subcomplex assembly factor 2 n=1 Tax=Clavelina lepadiformis TaxID=159417 RepID=A0ABP0F5X9_CLALP
MEGRDLDGNKYFEIPPQRYFLGMRENHKLKRIVEPYGIDYNAKREPGLLPTKITNEWDSWLRLRRTDPPTIEELEANIEQYHIIQERVKQLEEKVHKEKVTKVNPEINPGKEEQTVDSWTGPEKR